MSERCHAPTQVLGLMTIVDDDVVKEMTLFEFYELMERTQFYKTGMPSPVCRPVACDSPRPSLGTRASSLSVCNPMPVLVLMFAGSAQENLGEPVCACACAGMRASMSAYAKNIQLRNQHGHGDKHTDGSRRRA